jgi:hypothetical protein
VFEESLSKTWLACRYRFSIISNVDAHLLSQTIKQVKVPFEMIITSPQTRSYKPDRATVGALESLEGSRISTFAVKYRGYQVERFVPHLSLFRPPRRLPREYRYRCYCDPIATRAMLFVEPRSVLDPNQSLLQTTSGAICSRLRSERARVARREGLGRGSDG